MPISHVEGRTVMGTSHEHGRILEEIYTKHFLYLILLCRRIAQKFPE